MSSKESGSKQAQSANSSQPAVSSKDTGANPPSQYSQIKDGWGGRTNFQASYGLGMDPDGIAEGNSIQEAFAEADQHAGKAAK